MPRRPTTIPRPRERPRRTPNACVACRRSKIKCSGECPCKNCERRLMPCTFESPGVTSPSRTSREQNDGSQGSSLSPKRAVTSASDDYLCIDNAFLRSPETPTPVRLPNGRYSVWTSPFSHPSVANKSVYRKRHNWIWLAPSSAWSFNARLTLMLSQELNMKLPDDSPVFVAGDTYRLSWKIASSDEIPDVSGLPDMDHSRYLFETVKFHLGENYGLIQEDAFLKHLREFHTQDAVGKAMSNRLWFVQFLLVLAFGKAFLCRCRSRDEPPGASFFVRAMSIMPDISQLWQDSFLAIETLSLAGLYLYAVDRRESAHVYVSQAIRIAQMEGLHTQLPEGELGHETVAQCRRLWWIMYNLDRHISSAVGVPASMRDDEVTTLPMPSNYSQKESSLGLQVKLSRLLSQILKDIYYVERMRLDKFLKTTKSILEKMAEVTKEIESTIQARFQQPTDIISKETRHITLLYHQCVIIATRPILLSLLRERLRGIDQGDDDWQNFLLLTKPLAVAGVKAARKTLQILRTQDSLLETFLPFDLEFACGAALYLAIIKAVFQHNSEELAYDADVSSLLDEMIQNGNKVAEARQAELAHIEFLLAEIARRPSRSGISTQSPETQRSSSGQSANEHQLASVSAVSDGAILSCPAARGAAADYLAGEQLELFSEPAVLDATRRELIESVGISSHDFLALIEQMDFANTDMSWFRGDEFD